MKLIAKHMLYLISNAKTFLLEQKYYKVFQVGLRFKKSNFSLLTGNILERGGYSNYITYFIRNVCHYCNKLYH